MKKSNWIFAGLLGVSMLFVGCITAQTVPSRTLGPYDCTGCSLNITNPESNNVGTYAKTNTQLSFYKINSAMKPHDHIILCNSNVCADYELTDSSTWIQRSREQRVKGADDSGTPPSNPPSGGGAGPGSPGSTLSYWPGSSHVCAKTTTHWPDGSTTVEVDCKAV